MTLGVNPVAKYAAAGTVQEHLEPWLAELPTIDLMGGLSPEVALSFEPDLIMISSHFLPVESYDAIAKVFPTYLFNREGADWRQQLQKVAELLGKEEIADKKLCSLCSNSPSCPCNHHNLARQHFSRHRVHLYSPRSWTC